MEKTDRSDAHFGRNLLTRSAIIAISVALIVWFLPREEGQLFHYGVGKPWTYSSLIAQFDFPVYKTDDVIKHEQDSLTEMFQPYYNYDTDVEKQMEEKFLADFPTGLPGLPAAYKSLVYDQLHLLYQRGIMNTPEFNALQKDTTNMVRIVTGKQARGQLARDLYSTLSAYERLFQDERLAAQRQVLQKCNLNEYIEPNLIYDKERSDTELAELLSSIPIASGIVLTGQKIIDRGDIVDEQTHRVLESFEREVKRRNDTEHEMTSTTVGQIVFVTMMVLFFTIYLGLFRRDYFEKPRSIMMLYALITIFPIVVSLMMENNILSVYILPFAMTPIFVRIFMDSRTAFITHVIMVLICAAAVKYQYEFIIVQLVAGLAAIYSLRDLSRRAQVFKTALLVTIASAVIYFALQLMQSNAVLDLDTDMYYYLIVNGILLLLAYPLMYLIERTFGFTSNVTLFELSNTNKGLLRDLSEIAPGTFQHSITVGNLAAEIANRIEANSLLVRTGALYHDIGKMTNPVFFTENQAGVNPHDNMPYTESARIVISHVTEGLKMAEKTNLPAIIKNFILTHHGNGQTKYFYIKEQNEHPDEEIDKTPFTYPGPNPFTREQAILMMADSVEAASRSLSEYTEENIIAMVNRIIDSQLTDGYFRSCPITFRDIELAKQVLIDRLKNIYHTRISYPELQKTEPEPVEEPVEETEKTAQT
ncbi:MAG: HDIG domain-containing protein [Prevotella sp.]|nr:HDIG domain-containing protein [Prevotella sp.]